MAEAGPGRGERVQVALRVNGMFWVMGRVDLVGQGVVVNCSWSSSSYTQHVTTSDGRVPIVHEGTDHAFVFPSANERKGVNA